jgi:hypothetical protein
MVQWLFKIELNHVIYKCNEDYDLSHFEEPCPNEVKEAIATEVEKAYPLQRFAKRVRNCKTIAALNRILDDIFDIADRELVWCGMAPV